MHSTVGHSSSHIFKILEEDFIQLFLLDLMFRVLFWVAG